MEEAPYWRQYESDVTERIEGFVTVMFLNIGLKTEHEMSVG